MIQRKNILNEIFVRKKKKSTFYPKHHVSKIVHTIVCVVLSFINLKRTNSLCLQYKKMTPSTQKKQQQQQQNKNKKKTQKNKQIIC